MAEYIAYKIPIKHLCDNDIFFRCLVSVIKKTHQCMREVMEQSSDKVLENALANGGESHTVTHTSMQRVLITSYRNSLSKCIEAPGDMHIRMRLIDTLTEVHIHVHTHKHPLPHKRSQKTQPTLIPSCMKAVELINSSTAPQHKSG